MIFSTVKALMRNSGNLPRDFAEVERILRANTHHAVIVEDHRGDNFVDDHYCISVRDNALIHKQIAVTFGTNKADIWERTKIIDVETGVALCIDENKEDGALSYSECNLPPHEKTKSRKIFLDLADRPRSGYAQRIRAADFIL